MEETDTIICLKTKCVKLPQMNAYAKYFDKDNKYRNLLVNDKEILKKIFRNME